MEAGDTVLLQLSQAIAASVDPSASNDQRRNAYYLLENFRSSVSIEQKMQMAQIFVRNEHRCWNSSVVHYALKMLEEAVKTKWDTFTADQKAALKSTITNSISSADGKMDLVDGISRVLVEIIKLESAKAWPLIFQELEMLSNKGAAELYIVSVLILRLTDDIYRFKEGPSKSQRDRLESFKNVMADFIPFLVRSLLRSAQPELLHICNNLMQICSTIAEFAPVNFWWAGETQLVDTILIQLANYEPLQLEIAEFLCNLFERRHSKADSAFLLSQFFIQKPQYLEVITRRVQAAGPFNERTYKLCRRFCEVYAGLAFQLSIQDVLPAWFTEKHDGTESPLQKFTRLLFQMTSHPSAVIADTGLIAWNHLLSHKALSVLPELKLYGQPLLRHCLQLFLLHQMQSTNQFMESDFLRSNSEFREFLLLHRAHIVDVVRRVRKLFPSETLDFALGSLKLLLDTKQAEYEPWSALLYLLNNAQPPGKNSDENEPSIRSHLIRTSRHQVFELLRRLVAKEPDLKPGTISVRLSCVSKLTANFLPRLENDDDSIDDVRRELIIQVYAYILDLIRDTAVSEDEATRELHLHARNLLNSLCRNATETLGECYNDLTQMTIKLFSTGTEVLSVSDRTALLEALITLTKSDDDTAKKSTLVEEILAMVSPNWLETEFCLAVKTSADFVSYFGLDRSNTEERIFVERRQKLSFCSAVIAATVVNIKFTNPELMRLLENAFALISTMLNLYATDVVTMLPKSNRPVLEYMESDRQHILKPLFGNSVQTSKVSENIIRLQNWMQISLESACRIFGFAGRCFSSSFYEVPGLVGVLDTVLCQPLRALQLPLFRIRTCIRELVANLIHFCPEERFETIVVPFLTQFCSLITKVLVRCWSPTDEEAIEQEEVLKETLRRGFTTDYGNLVLQALLCDNPKQPNGLIDEDVEMADDTEDTSKATNKGFTRSHGDLSKPGRICLQTPGLAESIIVTVFNGLSWSDWQISLRFTNLAQVLVDNLPTLERVPLNAGGALYIVRAVLEGLKTHGQLESNQTPLLSLALSTYSVLKPRFPDEVAQAFAAESGQNMSFEHLDSVLFPKPGTRVSSDKAKREAFKKFFESTVKFLGDSSKQPVVSLNATRRTETVEQINPKNGLMIDDHHGLPLLFGNR